jgi:hypothetical protein
LKFYGSRVAAAGLQQIADFGHDWQGGDQRFMDLSGARFGLLM